jgi:ATP phosphoribosyltransferase regulatory subunit
MAKTLLPAGCYDLLPPYARQESELSSALLGVFESFGYQQVSPPLLEYTESMLSGRGSALAAQTFRVMDPDTNKVMGLRADITLQIARIAASRLVDQPHPLRLCYNGLIVRMHSEQLKGDRQLRQAGIELIGAASPEADAEVILVAAAALKKAGITKLSIDLNLPGIVSALLANERLDNETLQSLFAAISHKDISTISTLSFVHRDILIALLQSAGPADQALAAIERMELPASARQQCRELHEVLKILKQAGSKDWDITIDATENRGLSYHSGISFSIFVPGSASEIGRGGRYRIEAAMPNGDDVEATGFTLYVEALRNFLPAPDSQRRVFIAGGITDASAAELRDDGYVTVSSLPEFGNDEDEAKRLKCAFIYKNGTIKAIK